MLLSEWAERSYSYLKLNTSWKFKVLKPLASQRNQQANVRIHATADVSEQAIIGDGTVVWHQAQVREGARIGRDCIIGKGVYIDAGVVIGDNIKIQNYVSVFHGVTLEDGVFVGPHVCFTNDLRPRAINANGSLKAADDWILTKTLVKKGTALGANATIVCGITIGQWAMIGAGSVVTRDVPDFGLVRGNPARLVGFVDPAGRKMFKVKEENNSTIVAAKESNETFIINKEIWERIHD
jgi:acetyltransferase-like isoleucine patch superfamily enzyme